MITFYQELSDNYENCIGPHSVFKTLIDITTPNENET